MENKWWVALQEKLKNDIILQQTFGNRVWFLRISKEFANNQPYIIFNEWEQEWWEYSNNGHEKWLAIFPVIIDIVVPYSLIASWRSSREYIRSILSWFSGKLTDDREWEIVFKKFL